MDLKKIEEIIEYISEEYSCFDEVKEKVWYENFDTNEKEFIYKELFRRFNIFNIHIINNLDINVSYILKLAKPSYEMIYKSGHESWFRCEVWNEKQTLIGNLKDIVDYEEEILKYKLIYG